ncbi:hypothetical protein BTJ39_09695 [Izhakiella australiensis]|uniref:Uncharacterized protein n=1 Tax=Izhakiella australiensis TaxID=1926881 RepID=A0A1S8YM36_9GAMM|nr:hypothetical protein BTJ39_09695 [Izhakiella australiensis]
MNADERKYSLIHRVALKGKKSIKKLAQDPGFRLIIKPWRSSLHCLFWQASVHDPDQYYLDLS